MIPAKRYVCERTAVDVAVTGTGVCMCSHNLTDHGAAGCLRCAARVERPRLYRGEPAMYDARRSPDRQQGR